MLKPYESYRETGVVWIKKIPLSWDFIRIGTIFNERRNKVSDKDFEPLSVTKNGVVKQLATAAKSDDGDNRKLVLKNDFVINSRSDRKGSSGISPLDGSVSLINIVLEPTIENNGVFLHYLLKSLSFIEEYYKNGRGIVADLWTTRYSEMKTIMLPLPSTQEQDQIVKYLDWQTSKINKLINGKKKQIELLKEQKQAVINQAVTKGLDPNAEMKDSGVAWLGEIPKHWEVKRLKYFVSTNNETLSNNVDKNYELDYIDIGSVGFGYLKLAPEHYKFSSAPSRARRVVHTNDTIVSTVRTYLKSMCFIDEHLDGFIASTGFSVLTPNRKVLPQILSYSLCSDYFVNEVDTRSKGISYPAITDIDLISIKIALPNTIREQENIHKYITVITSKIDQIISKSQAEINIVLEYKTRLISDVVTGQVDVRNVVVPEFVAEEVIVDVEELEDLEEVEGEV